MVELAPQPIVPDLKMVRVWPQPIVEKRHTVVGLPTAIARMKKDPRGIDRIAFRDLVNAADAEQTRNTQKNTKLKNTF